MLKGKSFNRPAGLTCLCSSMPTKVYSYETVDKKSGKKDTIHGYIFLFEPFGWYIGMEKSYSDIKREHLDRVCSMLSSLRYGKNFNYLFAINYKGVILAHPYLKRGDDLKKYRGAKGAQIAQPMIKIALGKGEGYTSYWWKKNNGFGRRTNPQAGNRTPRAGKSAGRVIQSAKRFGVFSWEPPCGWSQVAG